MSTIFFQRNCAIACKEAAFPRMTGGKQRGLIILVVFIILFINVFSAQAAENKNNFQQEISYLFHLPGKSVVDFEPAKVSVLLGALRMDSDDPLNLSVPNNVPGTGIYYEFTIPASMAKVIRYSYNPEIPSFMVKPNALRTQSWLLGTAKGTLLTLINNPADAEKPRIFIGREKQQSTPAIATGTFYTYIEDRFMARFNYEGHDVLLSVSNMPGQSSRSHKGSIVGSDDDWLYFYSNVPGVTWGSPMSSIDSYIYESKSVQIIFEPKPGLTRVCIFTWMHAGWKGLNVIGKSDLKAGYERMAKSMREVLTSARLPSVENLADMVKEVYGLSEAELKERLKPLAEMLKTASQTDKILSDAKFQELLTGDNYLNSFSKEELRSELLKRRLYDLLKR